MKVRLNLATHPLENNRRFLLGALLAGWLGVTLLVVLGVYNLRVWRTTREWRSEMSLLQSENREFRGQRRDLEEFFKTAEARRVLDRAAFLNDVIERRSFPWTKVFMDLERSLPEGVRVTSISPRMQGGRVEVRLVVGAANDEGKLRFLKTLEESPEFSRIQVIGESRPARVEETDRVVLELIAWYAAT